MTVAPPALHRSPYGLCDLADRRPKFTDVPPPPALEAPSHNAEEAGCATPTGEAERPVCC